jgi:ureidoacrylate peracid hydrolase
MWWNHIQQIEPVSAVVLVIDMQNNFVMEGGSMFSEMGNRMIPHMASFLEECRKNGIEIIYTANKDDSAWGNIHQSIAPKCSELVIEKQARSAFFNTNLNEILKNRNIEVAAITGVLTDACCLASAFDAMSHGYKVAFLADLTGTIPYPDLGYGIGDAELQQKVTLGNVAFGIGHVLTANEFLKLIQSDIDN